jgi:hypothetical protein
MTSNGVHALYRFFDDAGELLYVGITMNPAARWKQHQGDKHWWTEVANITVEPHANRKMVLEAERLAIITEKPRYNIVHNTPSPPQVRIEWTCHGCELQIEDGEGHIRLDMADLHARRKANDDWEEEHGGADVTGWQAWPGPAEWLAKHYDCMWPDDESERDQYSIRVERLRTYPHLLAWSLHLGSKGWIHETNWDGLIYGFAGDLPA